MGEKVDFSLPSDVPFHMQVLIGCGTPVLTHPGQVRLGDREEVSLVLGLVHQPLHPHTKFLLPPQPSSVKKVWPRMLWPPTGFLFPEFF